ncbi:MAG: PP2C family serine/threonine-protein phosphatase [Planctomycetota bacterium]|nr:PP2C family serine/threonine-protein phosphatase [Planctomycetota bacterium]
MEANVNWSNCLDYAALTDVGMRRANNQDANAVQLAPDQATWTSRGHLFVVCDGMGAHAAGELASKLAAEAIPFSYFKQQDSNAADALRKSVREGNAQIFQRGQANAEFHGMGTTASALVLVPQGAIAAHVGDSRVYRLRDSTLEQLTFDHSLVWEMSAAGQLPKDSLPNFVPKNIITRSLGPHAEVQVDLEGPFPLKLGDTFLLCSDGLTGQVKDEEIGAILGSLPPAESARVLIDLANLRGGPDNITVIVVKITGRDMIGNSGQPAEPISITEEAAEVRSTKTIQYGSWGLAAVALIAAFAMAGAGQPVAAIVSLVIAVALAAIGYVQSSGATGPEVRQLTAGNMLGKGPHTKCVCQPSETLVSHLHKLVTQLRDAATAGDWSIDWSKFNTYARQGALAAEKHEYQQAVRDYSRALRAMMNELRSQRSKRPPGEDEGTESVLGK